MTKEVRELRIAIENEKNQAKALVAENKIEEAKAMKSEIDEMVAKLELLESLDDLEDKVAEGRGEEPKDKVQLADAFVAAVKASVTGAKLTDAQLTVLQNAMKEGVPADGGLIVPQDIDTAIRELRREIGSLEDLVRVETVTTLSGSRVVEKDAAITPFDNVEEEAEFGDAGNPQFENVDFKLKKKGGILKVSSELLEDSTQNVLAYLTRWLAKKQVATRNALIVAAINTATAGKEVDVKTLDELKAVFNTKLDPAIALTSCVVTNQDGFQWLDTLKTTDGKYALQPSVTDPAKMLLFGKYPIKVVANVVIPNGKAGTGKAKYPFICGDLFEGITLFDRGVTSIEANKSAGDLWGKDQTGIKVRERLDCKAVDKAAFVKAEFTVTA